MQNYKIAKIITKRNRKSIVQLTGTSIPTPTNKPNIIFTFHTIVVPTAATPAQTTIYDRLKTNLG